MTEENETDIPDKKKSDKLWRKLEILSNDDNVMPDEDEEFTPERDRRKKDRKSA